MAQLRCRECGSSFEVGAYPRGCPTCAAKGKLGLLEVTYAYDGETRRQLQEALEKPKRRTLWRFDCLLPLRAENEHTVTLGEGGTPLLNAGWLSCFTGAGQVYLKNETANPTWCSKDRANTVSVSIGRLLGAPGMVAITTGNHGASMVAYSARAGVPAIALCSPHSDGIHRAMISVCGGTAIVCEDPGPILRHLVHDCGWFPATSMGESDAPNPFGVEGCKTIAYEVCDDLQGLPDVVLVPAASGDLLYGVYKGFRELADLGFTKGCPRMIGCQAVGAAPLALAVHSHLQEVPILPNPTTVALSVGDATSGKHALEAVAASKGDVLTVSDAEILEAQRCLAANGLLVEAAAATTVAALASGVRSGAVGARERVVCLLTGAGVKWSTQFLSAAMGRVLTEPTLSTVSALVQAHQEDKARR